MDIIVINGSHRKQGATANILLKITNQLTTRQDVNIKFIHVADLNLNFCNGCGTCYKTGACIFFDDLEKLSVEIASADGIILGSPTYACNVSAQMKVIIDRGHFIMEQLLYGKYAMCVTTYENYGGNHVLKILQSVLFYAGAMVSASIIHKTSRSMNAKKQKKLNKRIIKTADKFYHDLSSKHTSLWNKIRHYLLFRFGIFPFVLKNRDTYHGVLQHWKKNGIHTAISTTSSDDSVT